MASDVRLRDVTEADLPIFFDHQRDPESNHMAAFPPRDRDAFFAHWAKILSDPTCTVKTIIFNGRVAGNVVSWGQPGERNVGYWIGKDYWGQGIATRALSEFLRLQDVRPLYAHVAKHNIASQRVLEKCGFTISGQAKVAADAPGGEGEDEEFIFRLDD
jgi:RimJ/RimL family protein N-acetyltransferase